MERQTQTIAIVNSTPLLLVQNGETLVPVKPICEALGIDPKTQIDKIKDDEDLNSVGGLSPATASDGKEYQMYCIPLKFVFGWLFTINPKNVKPEAQELIRKYRKECYEALYRHFTEYSDFVIERGNKTDEFLDAYREAQNGFKNAKEKMDKARKDLDEVRKRTFQEWKASGNQIRLFNEES